MRARRSVLALLAATLSLAALSATLVEGFQGHTDDGCEVEVHCLACRLAFDTAPDLPSQLPAVARALLTAREGGVPATFAPRTGDSRRAQPRAPPQA
jgi:hypothetical protein